MEKVLPNNSKRRNSGLTAIIAEKCGCDAGYVRKVLSGKQSPKTERAEKALNVIEVAEKILQAINQ